MKPKINKKEQDYIYSSLWEVPGFRWTDVPSTKTPKDFICHFEALKEEASWNL